MKAETLLIDQDGYGSKGFEWPSGTFYITMRKKMWRYAWTLNRRNAVDYFEDIFQETMSAFHVVYTTKPELEIRTNRHAFNLIKRIFWFAVVNDYRKYKDWYTKATPFPNGEMPERPDYSHDPEVEPLDRKLESFFPDADRYLELHENFMNRREKEFYHHYKQLLPTQVSDRKMREIICKAMNITPGNYQVLKTRVNGRIKQLITIFTYVQE